MCLGTMTWGNQNSEEDAHAQLDRAILHYGCNYIDTAGASRHIQLRSLNQFEKERA